MKTAVFQTRAYERPLFLQLNAPRRHELAFFEERLNRRTASLARGHAAVCVFVNDDAGAEVLEILAAGGTTLLATRSAGFNHIDLKAARRLGIRVVRVPAYSPHAVAEHTVALILALNRRIHRAHNRVREGNFSLEGLMGFDLAGRTAGVVGTGRIGAIVARILHGFGMKLLAFDLAPRPDLEALGVRYVGMEALLAQSDIVTLHCPLTPRTHHLIGAEALSRVKPGMMLVNTSRGALVDTRAVIDALKGGRVGHLGLDVYEEEGDLFFEDLSNEVIQDDVFSRLLTFPNVLVTAHQAFFTREAVHNIIDTTLQNLTDVEASGRCANEVLFEAVSGSQPPARDV